MVAYKLFPKAMRLCISTKERHQLTKELFKMIRKHLEKRGLVHTVEYSTAKVSDRNKFADLLHREEKAVFGDKGLEKIPFNFICSLG